jgi:hypothetical protein
MSKLMKVTRSKVGGSCDLKPKSQKRTPKVHKKLDFIDGVSCTLVNTSGFR